MSTAIRTRPQGARVRRATVVCGAGDVFSIQAERGVAGETVGVRGAGVSSQAGGSLEVAGRFQAASRADALAPAPPERATGERSYAGAPAPAVARVLANDAEPAFASELRSVLQEGRDVTQAPVLLSLTANGAGSPFASDRRVGPRRGARGYASARAAVSYSGPRVRFASGLWLSLSRRVSAARNWFPARVRGEGGGEMCKLASSSLVEAYPRSAPSVALFMTSLAPIGWETCSRIHLIARHRGGIHTARAAGFERVGSQGCWTGGGPEASGRERSPKEQKTSGATAARSAAPRITGVSSTKLVSGGGKNQYATPGLRSLLTSPMQVSDTAGVKDQGQISKMLMMRLEGHGLLENTGGQTKGDLNAWRLTPHGEEAAARVLYVKGNGAFETSQGRGAKRPAGVPAQTPVCSGTRTIEGAEIMRRSSCSEQTVPGGDVLIKTRPTNFHRNGRVNTVNIRPLDGCDAPGSDRRSVVVERFFSVQGTQRCAAARTDDRVKTCP
jgi:hypothetical protein